MALKGDRAVYVTDISHVTNQASVAGAVMVLATGQTTTASGQGINDQAGVIVPIGTGAPASGTIVVGIALDPVSAVDETKGHRNWHTGEQVVGEPLACLTDGWVFTNMISGTPTPGAPAYPAADAKLSPTQTNGIPAVGKFQTSKDADGYARVSVKIA